MLKKFKQGINTIITQLFPIVKLQLRTSLLRKNLRLFILHYLAYSSTSSLDSLSVRICVDCTNRFHPCGSPNQFNNCPKDIMPDICPSVRYATVFQRVLNCIWKLWITQPTEDILLNPDDIDSAFCRVLYHPNMAVVFAISDYPSWPSLWQSERIIVLQLNFQHESIHSNNTRPLIR